MYLETGKGKYKYFQIFKKLKGTAHYKNIYNSLYIDSINKF